MYSIHCIHYTIQVLDSYNLDPEKFKWLDIDIRSDMDAIQNQMKQVKHQRYLDNKTLIRNIDKEGGNSEPKDT